MITKTEAREILKAMDEKRVIYHPSMLRDPEGRF